MFVLAKHSVRSAVCICILAYTVLLLISSRVFADDASRAAAVVIKIRGFAEKAEAEIPEALAGSKDAHAAAKVGEKAFDKAVTAARDADKAKDSATAARDAAEAAAREAASAKGEAETAARAGDCNAVNAAAAKAAAAANAAESEADKAAVARQDVNKNVSITDEAKKQAHSEYSRAHAAAKRSQDAADAARAAAESASDAFANAFGVSPVFSDIGKHVKDGEISYSGATEKYVQDAGGLTVRINQASGEANAAKANAILLADTADNYSKMSYGLAKHAAAAERDVIDALGAARRARDRAKADAGTTQQNASDCKTALKECVCNCEDVSRYLSGQFNGDKRSVTCVRSCVGKCLAAFVQVELVLNLSGHNPFGDPPISDPRGCAYSYSPWSDCKNGRQTRTVTSTDPVKCPVPQDTTWRTCTILCNYTYTDWGPCINGKQTRTVTSLPDGHCTGTPVTERPCGVTPPPCTYEYSPWSACVNGNQTRTVSASPPGCAGTPDILIRTCSCFHSGAFSGCNSGCGFGGSLNIAVSGATVTVSSFGVNGAQSFTASGSSATSSNTNLTVFGAPGHSCTINCSGLIHCQRSNNPGIQCNEQCVYQ